ncbi:alkaline phosphatase D family protein [Phycicoccus sp. Soil748]|uniref:alkaline phosphatase D family protein n=1 Tax=Phycicoccus sp. Soil748 TaxID=1736397 RepID=UPI00070349E7|nr:alkaline phosphatase D family protein [Phycicoccus sp. Soil748]KRE58951.1 glycoside hydrolase [Phycicoccus sp. Soil748]
MPPLEDSPLTLGPLLRYVGETSATVWVQTRQHATVTVRAFGRSWEASTFSAHGHHYALVVLDGLEPGATSEYEVDVDGDTAWPPKGPGVDALTASLPPSRVTTHRHSEPTRMAFGSCRTSVPHDAEGNKSNGVDALRAYAFHLTRTDPAEWPHLVVFLGDQVYADETSEEMREFIASRRSLDEPPGEELKDYEEYAHLYRLAWTDPLNRWLLSTLPSAMIFDDHDIRDDWNTSQDWHREMNAKPWWHERIVGGLASYWVYQHAGNLSPEDLAQDEVWQLIAEHAGSGAAGELDLTEVLDALAARVDAQPETYRWSYARDLGESKLVVVDSRAARLLTPDRRSILDDDEMAWVDGQLRGDVDHLFIATSLPFLMAQGIHDLEAINEAMSNGAWGPRVARWGEKMRRALDLEHWAAFQEGFKQVLDMVVEVAHGERGTAPGTITFLSGDVHNSYVTEIDPKELGPGSSRIIQAVCSPIRNPLPRQARIAQAMLGKGLARPLQLLVARTSKVPNAPYQWPMTEGPWFDNNLATLQVRGRGLVMRWDLGEVKGDKYDEPDLREVARVVIS